MRRPHRPQHQAGHARARVTHWSGRRRQFRHATAVRVTGRQFRMRRFNGVRPLGRPPLALARRHDLVAPDAHGNPPAEKFNQHPNPPGIVEMNQFADPVCECASEDPHRLAGLQPVI